VGDGLGDCTGVGLDLDGDGLGEVVGGVDGAVGVGEDDTTVGVGVTGGGGGEVAVDVQFTATEPAGVNVIVPAPD
jgi:hypothetical protein